MRVLHIDAGLSSSESVSRLLTAAIVKKLQTQHPALTIKYRDLVADEMPYMNLKTIPGSHPVSVMQDLLSEGEKQDRTKTEAALEEFLSADVIVLGIPMYNFGIPAQLKSWFDAIVIPGKTFTYTAEGPIGLVVSKRMIVAIKPRELLRPDRTSVVDGACRIVCAGCPFVHRNFGT